MTLKALPHALSVCRLSRESDMDLTRDFYFIAKTDEELSLVCKTADAPAQAAAREDGWRCFRIQGVLDFSLIGILARLSTLLAQNGIGLFAVSTYNTDYILVKEESFDRALDILEENGYTVAR
ncbi:MAG: ACT domain-containing protein [Clostridia bacterium]|nr:ACT domain-containing protein [Clostridia bacterium]